MNRIIIVFMVIGCLVGIAGCDNVLNKEEVLSSEDHALAEASFNDLVRIGLFINNPGFATDSCFTITKIDTGFPVIINVDFTEVCTSQIYGIRLTGSLIAFVSAPFEDVNATITVHPHDLTINDYGVDGLLTITNKGTNNEGQQVLDVKVDSALITLSGIQEGGLISWECDYQYTLVEENSSFVIDDVYEITGKATGTNTDGRAFSALISGTLLKDNGCRWVEKGKTTVSPDGRSEQALDYGIGSCDNAANVNDVPIHMR